MNKTGMMVVFAGALICSSVVFAQNSDEITNADSAVTSDDAGANETINDEGYGNDEEYYDAEESNEAMENAQDNGEIDDAADVTTDNIQENFENSEAVNTPMNPDNNAPSAP